MPSSLSRCWEKIPSLELLWNKWVRSPHRSRLAVTAALVVFAALVFCLPLAWAGTASFRKAHDICYAKFVTLRVALEVEINGPERATAYLFPGHVILSVTVIASLLSNVAWMYHSPYQLGGGRTGTVSLEASTLDVKLGTFFGVQLLTNLALTLLKQWKCTESGVTNVVLDSVDLMVGYGVQGLVANLLCHRFLLERATTMVNKIMEAQNDKSIGFFSLSKLESALKWEFRSLAIVPVAVFAFMIGFDSVAFAMIGLVAASVLVTHFAFSIVVTMIFLRPLVVVLGIKTGSKSDMDRRLERTIRWTLAGTSVAVIVSSLSYINCIGFVIWPEILENPWLHPQIFAGNAASVAKDLGMVMASGIAATMLTNSQVLPKMVRMKKNTFTSFGGKKNSTRSNDKQESSENDLQAPAPKYEVNASSMEFE